MCRVLVVDDDKTRLSRVARLVGDIVPGCEIISWTSFPDAKAWLEGPAVPSLDLAIVDLFLKSEPPEDRGEGAGLIKRIREQFHRCPCILISSYESLDDLKLRLPDSRGVKFVSFNYTAQSMWGQLRESIADALQAQAAAAGLH